MTIDVITALIMLSLTGAGSRFLEHRVGDPELAMPLATEPGAFEQPKVDFLGL
jgi:hypothetical protein